MNTPNWPVRWPEFLELTQDTVVPRSRKYAEAARSMDGGPFALSPARQADITKRREQIWNWAWHPDFSLTDFRTWVSSRAMDAILGQPKFNLWEHDSLYHTRNASLDSWITFWWNPIDTNLSEDDLIAALIRGIEWGVLSRKTAGSERATQEDVCWRLRGFISSLPDT